jgi:hypothetical protein
MRDRLALSVHRAPRDELYDLERDPKETTSIASIDRR